MKIPQLLLLFAVLVFSSITPHLCDAASINDTLTCYFERNGLSLNAFYIGDSVHNVKWIFKNSSGYELTKYIHPCYNSNTTEHKHDITFKCHYTEGRIMLQAMVSDVWTEMNILLYISNATDKMISKERSDCRYYILQTRGSDVLLECVLNKMYTLPQWQGPPNFETYIHQGTRTFNPKLAIVMENRIHLDNDRNLVIKSVKDSDNGTYKCYHIEGGRHMFELVVTDPVNTTDTENTTGYEGVSKPTPQQNAWHTAVGGVISAVGICAVIIGVICFIRRKQCRRMHQCTTSATSKREPGSWCSANCLQCKKRYEGETTGDGTERNLLRNSLEILQANAIDRPQQQPHNPVMHQDDHDRDIGDHDGDVPDNHPGNPYEHKDAHERQEDIPNNYPNGQLDEHTASISTSVSVVREDSVKIYCETSEQSDGRWKAVCVKLYSDGSLQWGELKISLKNVWKVLQCGDQLEKNISSTLPQGTVSQCLLAVPAKTSSKPYYFLFDSAEELEDWMKAVRGITPQLLLQHDLIAFYETFCSQVPINPLNLGSGQKLLEIHVPPSLKITDRNRPKNQSKLKVIESYQDIFMKTDQEAYQNIYISSPAGYGKTTFCKRIALTWCQAHLPIESDNKWFNENDLKVMRMFKFLFVIYLRDARERECDVDHMIQNMVINELANSARFKSLVFLQNLLSTEKCLVVMDGLDEWSHPLNSQCLAANTKLPHSRARKNCTILTTSRSWKFDVAQLELQQMDYHLELNGLEGHLLDRLISRIVKQMKEHYEKEKNTSDFKRMIKFHKLNALCKIPIILMQLLTLWFQDIPIGRSQCEIYSNMAEFLLKQYHNKKGLCIDTKLTLTNKLSDSNNDQQYPVCFKDNIYCKASMEFLLKLGRLAFNILFSSNQESSLKFDNADVQEYISGEDLTMGREVGFLTTEKVTSLIDKKPNTSFLHKTFQEFFAALHLAMNTEDLKAMEKVVSICCSTEKILEISQMLMFMSGLCPQVLSQLWECLMQVVSADSDTKTDRSSCELSPWKSTESHKGSTLRQVQVIMADCLTESKLNGHKDVCLPINDISIDVYITHGVWLTEFKPLFNIPVYSLFIWKVSNSETVKDILNSVTTFNLIQKLWLAEVSETFVSQLIHSLKMKSKAWENLECLILEHMCNGMSSDVLRSLVDCILQLAKSVNVMLAECKICLTDWNTYVQSCPLLAVNLIEDNGQSVTLQFHTIKDKV